MGYPLQTGAPQITINGKNYAVGAFQWVNPVGNFDTFGVYVQQLDGAWNLEATVKPIQYTNPGDLLQAVKAAGGRVAFIKWLTDQINAMFAKVFAAPAPTPTTEPTTDAEAMAQIVAAINAMKITVVNGVPVLA
jgi:hypothetical protein